MDCKHIYKSALIALLGSIVACSGSSKLTREQTLVMEQSGAEKILVEKIATNELFDDKNIDKNEAIVITKIYSFGRKYIRFNGIPIPKSDDYRTSAMLFSSLDDPDTEFLASGPGYHVYQVPAGKYYVSRITASQPFMGGSIRAISDIKYNYIKGSALDANENPQYGSLTLSPGEVYYLGDIQTYGAAIDIKMYPNFKTKNNETTMKAYLDSYYPSLSNRVKTQLFTVVRPDAHTKEILDSMEPSRLKARRLELEGRLSQPLDLHGESSKHAYLSDGFIQRLNSDEKRSTIYREIHDSWLNDPKLFDLVKQQVFEYAENYDDINTSKNEAHWAFKALASSGLQRYRTTFETIQKMNGSPKRSKQALKYLNQLNQRTLIAREIHSDEYVNSHWKWEEQHAANMIASSDAKTRVFGAEQIVRNNLYDKPMLDHLSKVLLNSVKSAEYDRYSRKFQINLSKALARCKDLSYRPVLQKVMIQAIDKKVRAYAESYIDYLEDSVD